MVKTKIEGLEAGSGRLIQKKFPICLNAQTDIWWRQDHLAGDVPIVSVSKGLEVGSGRMMSELIPSALGRKQPAAFLSGPSFAKEVMDLRPTGVVAASKVRGKHTRKQGLPAQLPANFQ